MFVDMLFLYKYWRINKCVSVLTCCIGGETNLEKCSKLFTVTQHLSSKSAIQLSHVSTCWLAHNRNRCNDRR